ncbi:uncharacterized protein LOC126438164 [Schistocerca serialis cubense]|uniref:uncharacterized protein LOC126438164 n=1 Tax=Schistocerca serialis cubense TaxID=2023355 RepID=UPI00214F1D9D|nr:uncharacterized protein LOC126438164 [Schistocerca serialis cubense]
MASAPAPACDASLSPVALSVAALENEATETHSNIRKLETLRKKKGKLLNNLIYLKRCRDQDIVHKFLQFKFNIDTHKARSIYRRPSKSLPKERIQQVRRELDFNNKQLLQIHLLLSSTLSPTDWNNVDRITLLQAYAASETAAIRQKKKFEQLAETTRNTTPRLDTSRTVVNLSPHPTSTAAPEALAKGLNFAVTPERIPTE